MVFPGDLDGKESACNAGDLGSVTGSGRFAGEGNGYPLQYSGLENSNDRGTWQAMGLQRVGTKLSDFHFQALLFLSLCLLWV